MSDFDIRFLRDEPDDERADLILGEIHVGSFRERFRTSVTFWDASRYEEQWAGAVSRLLTTSDRTALLTSLTDPSSANFVRWWALYREGDVVAVQEQICFMESLSEPFDPDSIERFVEPRETVSEDGRPISEWFTATADLQAFLDQKRAR